MREVNDPNDDIIGFEFKSDSGGTLRVVRTDPENRQYVICVERAGELEITTVRQAKQVRRAKELMRQ